MGVTIAVLPIYQYRHDPNDIVVVTVWKAATNWERDLSPFTLGPCKLYEKHVSKNMENAWQYAKVYTQHMNFKGQPTAEYFKWAKQGWATAEAHRYPMGKGAVPEFSYWDGERLGYIDARKTIYGPLYAEAVQRTHGFRVLLKKYRGLEHSRLVLLDYDAYDHAADGMTLTDVLNEPKRKMGHAFVLAMLLKNDRALKQMKLRSR